MIDILTVVYNNYDMLDIFIINLKHLQGDYKVLVCDNSPNVIEKRHYYTDKITTYTLPTKGIDGETHGAALDFLVKQATSDIICTMDTDFFWLESDILRTTQMAFDCGCEAVGCAGWYEDFQSVIDTKYPSRAGHLAPVVWGQFLKREFALKHSFVCTAKEATEARETGWRHRQALIESSANMIVFSGFRYPNQEYPNACYFGKSEKPVGLHMLKGSILSWDYNIIQRMIDKYKK